MVRAPSRQRGLTVLEVVLSAILLVTLAASVHTVGTADMAFLLRSFRETAALRAAASHVERLRAGDLPLLRGDRRAALDGEARGALPGAVARESVTLITGSLAEVRVTVRWEEPGGGSAEIHLDALVAREIPPVRRQRGFTLLEVLVSVGLLTIVVLSTGWVTLAARQAAALTVGHADDVRQIRHALGSVERDLRRSASVERTGGAVVLHGPGPTVRYEMRDGVLWRTGDGPPAVVARRLAVFDVTVTSDGALARVAMRPRGRQAPGVPGPAVISLVHLRAGDGR